MHSPQWLHNDPASKRDLIAQLRHATKAREERVRWCINALRIGFRISLDDVRSETSLGDLAPAGPLWLLRPRNQLARALVFLIAQRSGQSRPWHELSVTEIVDLLRATEVPTDASRARVQLDWPWYAYHSLRTNIQRIRTVAAREELALESLIKEYWPQFPDETFIIKVLLDTLAGHVQIPPGFFRPQDYVLGRNMGRVFDRIEESVMGELRHMLKPAEYDGWRNPEKDPILPPGVDPNEDLLSEGHTAEGRRRDPYGDDLGYSVHYLVHAGLQCLELVNTRERGGWS